MSDPVIVTGATGFVGRAVLAELVACGQPVVASYTRAPGPALPGVTWVQADLLTPEGRAAIAGKGARMMHCAWEVEHGAFWTSPANALWRAATRDLAARFWASGGERLVALGSCAEYDVGADGPWNEDRPLNPATPYGVEKAGLFQDHGAYPGLVWARLFHLYGAGEGPRRLIPSLIAGLRAGQRVEVRASGLIRDYASTRHVARCLVALLHSPAQGAVDIGSGTPRSLGDLAAHLAAQIGRPDLLHLSHEPGPSDPVRMVPELARLHRWIGPLREDPMQGLDHLLRLG